MPNRSSTSTLLLCVFACVAYVTECQKLSRSWIKTTFSQRHNHLRDLLREGKLDGQPRAKDLPPLKWDTELESTARRHAEKCTHTHDRNGDRMTRLFPRVGQNMAFGNDIEELIEMWIAEHEHYNYKTGGCTGVCGHYTQMVDETSTHMGCAAVDCSGKSIYTIHAVCNYGPAGNIIGTKPYQVESQHVGGSARQQSSNNDEPFRQNVWSTNEPSSGANKKYTANTVDGLQPRKQSNRRDNYGQQSDAMYFKPQNIRGISGKFSPKAPAKYTVHKIKYPKGIKQSNGRRRYGQQLRIVYNRPQNTRRTSGRFSPGTHKIYNLRRHSNVPAAPNTWLHQRNGKYLNSYYRSNQFQNRPIYTWRSQRKQNLNPRYKALDRFSAWK